MPIVLGGGISGLSAAYYLQKYPKFAKSIKLFEAKNRFGGWIKTDYPINNKNVRFEHGPRTLRPKGVKGLNTLALCSELGLNNDVLPIKSSHPAAKNRLLATNEQLCLLPSSLTSAFKTSAPFTKPLVSALMHDYRNGFKGDRLSDDTIYNFAERRFGTEIAKYIISSMMCGICAGDAKEISVKFLMKELFEWEQKHGSVTAGIYHKTMDRFKNKNPQPPSQPQTNLEKQSTMEKWSIYSMNNGLETLPNALVNDLKAKNIELHANSNCENIEFHKNGSSITVNGKVHQTDSVVCSLPAFEIGKLLGKQHPKLANELNAIPYVDVAVINLLFKGKTIIKTPAFGFLVPPCENRSILGVIYDSCCFDMDGNTVLTVMMGGKWFRERFGAGNEAELYSKAMQEIHSILKIDDVPDVYNVNILRKCIPQYLVGHFDRCERIFKYIYDNQLPLKLCGSAYDGVGVNDTIYSAKTAVDSLIK